MASKLKVRRGVVDTKKIARNVEKMPKAQSRKAKVAFTSTGSTNYNLAISGKGKDGGIARGRVNNIVGDKSSGKTLIALEIAFHFWKYIKDAPTFGLFPKVKKVKIYYDNPEGVMDFPIKEMYGEEFLNAVKWESSKHIGAWGRKIGRLLLEHKKGVAVLHITDSLDSLDSEEGAKRFEEAAKKDKNLEGSYDLEKQAYLSKSFFKNLCRLQQKIDFTVVIISQVREKIGVTFGKKTYRAGGKGLDFYSHVVAWLAEVEKMRRTIKGHERVYAIRTRINIEKNKCSKPFRNAETIILYDYGIDDIAAMMAWLFGPRATITKKHVKAVFGKCPKYKGRAKSYSRNNLIRWIENRSLEGVLQEHVESVWAEIEDCFKPTGRKRRF